MIRRFSSALFLIAAAALAVFPQPDISASAFEKKAGT